MQARLNAAAAERAESIAVLEVLLDTPEAEMACRASVLVVVLVVIVVVLTREGVYEIVRPK